LFEKKNRTFLRRESLKRINDRISRAGVYKKDPNVKDRKIEGGEGPTWRVLSKQLSNQSPSKGKNRSLIVEEGGKGWGTGISAKGQQ